MSGFVPPELTGVWRREAITTPNGYRDAETRVFWLQTRSWYADIRVRAERPLRTGATGFADYPDKDLIELAAVQGFAGQLSARDGVCLWRRDLDVQPPGPEPDEAAYSIAGDVMIEDGLHADYQEIWAREADSGAPLLAFTLQAPATSETGPGAGPAGLLVIAGDHFLSIARRPTPLPRGNDLGAIVSRLLAAGDRDGAIAALSMRLCYGRITVGWTIALSSLPWLEGRSLWADAPARLDLASGTLTQDGPAGQGVWTLTDASAPIREWAGLFGG